MDVVEEFNDIPFLRHLGIELVSATDGVAEGRLDLSAAHSLHADRLLAHGGVAFSLADTVGAAAVASRTGTPGPTVDMRIDYLRPATADLSASGRVVHGGATVSTVEVEVSDDDEALVASAVGVYKTGGGG